MVDPQDRSRLVVIILFTCGVCTFVATVQNRAKQKQTSLANLKWPTSRSLVCFEFGHRTDVWTDTIIKNYDPLWLLGLVGQFSNSLLLYVGVFLLQNSWYIQVSYNTKSKGFSEFKKLIGNICYFVFPMQAFVLHYRVYHGLPLFYKFYG